MKFVYPDTKSVTRGEPRNAYSQPRAARRVVQEMATRSSALLLTPIKTLVWETRRVLTRFFAD
jgi:hypothetical protein